MSQQFMLELGARLPGAAPRATAASTTTGQAFRVPSLVLLVASIVASATACVDRGPSPSPSPSGWPTRTPFPLPSGAVDVPIPTAAPATSEPAVWACAASILAPVTVEWNAASHVLSFGGRNLIWPRGFSAREYNGRLEIVEPDGSVIGRAGDLLSELGGDDGGICSVNLKVYGPAE